ncbi:unnamed protein product [Camellia sinensis]
MIMDGLSGAEKTTNPNILRVEQHPRTTEQRDEEESDGGGEDPDLYNPAKRKTETILICGMGISRFE